MAVLRSRSVRGGSGLGRRRGGGWHGVAGAGARGRGGGEAGAEGEGLLRAAEGGAHDGGDGVAVVLGGDADQVPGGRLGPRTSAMRANAISSRSCGAHPMSPRRWRRARALAARTARRSMPSWVARSKSVDTWICAENRL